MEEIVTSVKRVTDIMAEISAASQEQSNGIDQVNTAVSQMDKMTQQNAALVEEAAAAAKSMEEQTDELSRIVSVFQTGVTAGRSAPVAAAQRNPAAPRQTKAAAPAARKAATPRQAVPVEADQDDWKEF